MEYEFYYISYDTTLEEIVSSPLAIFGGFKGNLSKLLSYGTDIPDEKSNFDRIVEHYSHTDLQKEANNMASRRLSLVRAGTVLLLPKGTLDMELTILTGRNLFVKDISSFSAFYGHYLNLLRNEGFTPAFRKVSKLDDVELRNYDISVWVWSRAASQNGNTLLDLTKYVESCTTTVNGTQNTFTISLQAVSNRAIPMNDELIDRVNIDKSSEQWSVWDYINLEGREPERFLTPWFQQVIQQNDIFFIRFERLAMETVADRVVANETDIISSSNLPGKVYDMIGLVDNVNCKFNPGTVDMTVEVTGRDLTKLLIEDGSYFFPLLFTENSEALFFDTQDTNKWFKRTFLKGTFDYLLLYKMQSIRNSLAFVVNQLTNLGVCNDELFNSYDDRGAGNEREGAGLGGRRTQVLRIAGENKDQLEWNLVSGIWQIVDVLVDEQIDDRRIANSQISNPNSNLQSVVESFCQRPFVEFFGDTYGDKFVFIARTPPFTRNAILSILDSIDYIDVNLRDIEELDTSWSTTFYTWFEIDPRNMFLGSSNSIALAYVPVVYFPEIAEAFGNKQLKVVDNYISNRALVGETIVENRDEFKQKVIEDFLYVIESFCYLPFTETGTITLRRDRRIKAKTWVKVGNRLFYVESVTNSFTAMGERVEGRTTLNVSRGMYIEYIKGKWIESLNKEINYWSPVKLDVIRNVLIQKLRVFSTSEEAEAAGATGETKIKIAKNTVKASFGTDRVAFDFFLQRRQLYE
ncbi:MAG TPA: hypothetical protein PK588_07645 [Paludibacteraceae bacterium]|nr:hypothetical protein [Paludibacteraceae bacterium]